MNNTIFSKGDDGRIILGVDPGTVFTGYALIHKGAILDFGCIRPPKKELLSNRYHVIFRGLHHLIALYKVTEMAVETPFVYKNAQSAIKLGSALGCAIIAAKEHGIRVFAYAPCEAKRGITGTGRATKEQVETMLRAQFHLNKDCLQPDASDALSIAVHHSRNLIGINKRTLREL